MNRRPGCQIRRFITGLAIALTAVACRHAAAQAVVRGIESVPVAGAEPPEPEQVSPIVVRGIESRPTGDLPQSRARHGASPGRERSAGGWLSSGQQPSRLGVQPTSFQHSNSPRRGQPAPSFAELNAPRSSPDRLNWVARAPDRAGDGPSPQPAPDPRFGGHAEEVAPRPVGPETPWPEEAWDGAEYPEGFDCEACDELPCRADDRDTICGICCGNSVVCQYLFARKNWENLQLHSGVTGFKGQPDLGRNGNFGFHQGFNLGAPFLDEFGIGRQSGIRVVESDISGGGGSTANRFQVFYTSGFFHRPMIEGWQYGIVSDYLRDDFGAALTVAQMRWEFSYVTCCGHEAGAWMTTRLASDSADRFGPSEQRVRWEPADMYLAFYRWNGCDGRTARIWAGATGQGEAVLGSDGSIRLAPRWAVQSAFGYRIPRNSAENGGASQESWGISMNVVWLPFGLPCFGGVKNPYRPLFNVADNATFFVNQF